jgi:hypothetical protein
MKEKMVCGGLLSLRLMKANLVGASLVGMPISNMRIVMGNNLEEAGYTTKASFLRIDLIGMAF